MQVGKIRAGFFSTEAADGVLSRYRSVYVFTLISLVTQGA